jgi:hypothetical protein
MRPCQSSDCWMDNGRRTAHARGRGIGR